MQQKTYRERMFDKAWRLDLAKDERTTTSDNIMRAQWANALAYYLVLRENALPPGPGITLRERVQGGDYRAQESRIHHSMDARRKLSDAREHITARAVRLIDEIFVNETPAKIAGRSVNLGYAGANVSTAVVRFILREAGELLFKHFSAESRDGKFHSEYIRPSP